MRKTVITSFIQIAVSPLLAAAASVKYRLKEIPGAIGTGITVAGVIVGAALGAALIGYICMGLWGYVCIDVVVYTIKDVTEESPKVFVPLAMSPVFMIIGLLHALAGWGIYHFVTHKLMPWFRVTSEKAVLFSLLREGGYFKVNRYIYEGGTRTRQRIMVRVLPSKDPDAISIEYLASDIDYPPLHEGVRVRSIDHLRYLRYEPVPEDELLLHAWYPYMSESYRRVIAGEEVA